MAFGIEGLNIIPIIVYTIGFGILIIASLMLLILGFDALENPSVAIISTIIPLSLSFGLIWDYAPKLKLIYLIYTILGFMGITLSRLLIKGKLSNLILTIVHGIAGLLIFFLPIIAIIGKHVPPIFLWVSIGGGFLGIGGSMLYVLKSGNGFFPRTTILKAFPILLFMATVSFVIGFAAFK